jgi:hypothetical protein
MPAERCAPEIIQEAAMGRADHPCSSWVHCNTGKQVKWVKIYGRPGIYCVEAGYLKVIDQGTNAALKHFNPQQKVYLRLISRPAIRVQGRTLFASKTYAPQRYFAVDHLPVDGTAQGLG